MSGRSKDRPAFLAGKPGASRWPSSSAPSCRRSSRSTWATRRSAGTARCSSWRLARCFCSATRCWRAVCCCGCRCSCCPCTCWDSWHTWRCCGRTGRGCPPTRGAACAPRCSASATAAAGRALACQRWWVCTGRCKCCWATTALCIWVCLQSFSTSLFIFPLSLRFLFLQSPFTLQSGYLATFFPLLFVSSPIVFLFSSQFLSCQFHYLEIRS